MTTRKKITIVFLMLATMGFLGRGFFNLFKGPGAHFQAWPTTQATIISSELTQAVHTGNANDGAWGSRQVSFRTWQLDVSFSYQINGKIYIGTHPAPIRIRSLVIEGDGPASDTLINLQKQFSIGSQTIAYVNPDNPAEAYILAWKPLGDTLAGWFQIGFGVLLGIWLTKILIK